MKKMVFIFAFLGCVFSAVGYDLSGPDGLTLSNCVVSEVRNGSALVRHSSGIGTYDVARFTATGESNETFSALIDAYKAKQKAISLAPKPTLANANAWTFPSGAVVKGQHFSSTELEKIYDRVKRKYWINATGNPEEATLVRGKIQSLVEEEGIVIVLSGNTIVAIEGLPDVSSRVDDDPVSEMVQLRGSYAYVTVMGAKKKVRRYRVVRPMTMNEFRYFVETQAETSFDEVKDAVTEKRKETEARRDTVADPIDDGTIDTDAYAADMARRKQEARRQQREFYRMKGPKDFH